MKDANKLRKEFFPEGVKESKKPDYFFRGRFVDGKSLNDIKWSNADNLKSKIQKRLSDAFKQADDAYLEIPTSISKDLIKNAINGKLKSSTHSHIINREKNSMYSHKIRQPRQKQG